jgi:hypothetical protein
MMTFSESARRSGVQVALDAPLSDSGASCAVDGNRRRRFGIWLLAVWVVLSLAWTGAVFSQFYYQVSAQADMSREVELDLDSASCDGGPCKASLRATPQENWSGIAETYMQFGYVSLLEWTILPPAALLLAAGIAGTMLLRRRLAAGA